MSRGPDLVRALVLWRLEDLGLGTPAQVLVDSLSVEGTATRPVPPEHSAGVTAFRKLTQHARRRTVERVLDGL